MKRKLKILAITGATASGKTKYAINLAKKYDGEIISADSRIVYKYFDIATAKPTMEERENIPHHLIDIIEPEESFCVADFMDRTTELINDITKRGKLPIIAGGTGLYFKVLCENYALPRVAANYDLRKELEEYANTHGAEKLHLLLQEADPETATKVHPNNVVRVIRTLEIIKTLNQPLSSLQRKNSESEFDIDFIGLNFESRAELYDRINKRVDLMIKNGLIEEAKSLFDKYGKITSLMNTIGYQELIPFFENQTTKDEAISKIKQHTRNYGKRQLSLLNALNDIKWINAKLLK